RAGYRAYFTAFDEIDFVEAPEVCSVMDAGAAHDAAVEDRPLTLGRLLRRFTICVGLKIRMIGKQIFAEDFDFVVCEVGFREARTLLEHNNTETVGRELFRENAAGGAGAYDDEIDFVGWSVFCCVELGRLHTSPLFFASVGAGCQPAYCLS